MNTKTPQIRVKALPHFDGLDLPSYGTAQSAGMDVRAAIDEDMVLEVGARTLIPTGFTMALPGGYEAQIRPRSGLAIKHGISVLNSPGTIDADYRGEVKIILANLSDQPFTITRGMRIAQMVIAPVTQIGWQGVDTLDETARGADGFGSTGT